MEELLAELVRRGIRLRARGDRLRYHPRSAMTPALEVRVTAHKQELLELLTATECMPARRLLAAPPHLRSTVEHILALFPGARVTDVQRDQSPVAEEAVAWVTDPRSATELVQPRSGWTPTSWRDRLLYLAGRCEDDHSTRATELRRAAIAMTPSWVEAFEERAAINEHDGGLPRAQAESAAASDVVRLSNRGEKRP